MTKDENIIFLQILVFITFSIMFIFIIMFYKLIHEKEYYKNDYMNNYEFAENSYQKNKIV